MFELLDSDAKIALRITEIGALYNAEIELDFKSDGEVTIKPLNGFDVDTNATELESFVNRLVESLIEYTKNKISL